ncbi:MAG: tetratricopeptide repeat protein [Prochlorococcaceae cyanobacterium]
MSGLQDRVAVDQAAPLEQALQAFGAGDLAGAEALLHSLWERQPASEVAALQGQVLRAAGRWAEAIDWFERALEADPADARPRIAVGQIQRQQGDGEAARASFEQVALQAGLALAFAPEQPLRLLELGLAYAELEQPEDAIGALEAALAVDPELVEAHRSLAVLLHQQGRIAEAAGHHQALARLDPGSLGPRIESALALQRAGDAEGCLRQLEALLMEAPQAPLLTEAFQFVASTAGAPWLERRRQVAGAYWDSFGVGASASASPPVPASPRGPLRVGILSAELGTHPVGHFLESVLRHHNPSRLQLELIETQPRWEERNRSLRALAHHALLLPQADLTARRALIRERGYQVIVETSGFTSASGLPLLAERLAPVQCHWVGFHASTHLPTLDWFIADAALLPPDLEGQFSERIWRLPRPWAAYTPPAELPAAASLAAGEPPVFGSCNQIAKLGPETLIYWAAALRAVPEARLLVKHRHSADPQVRERITAALEAAGVDPARLRFEGWAAHWAAHMAAYNRIDLALDATPWSSATTAFEALAMGTPLVAICGATLAGRMSSAVLEGFGEPGWIAEDPEAFAAIARRLSADLPGLRAARAERRRRALAGPLFDGADLARALEQALEGMVGQACGSFS